MQVFYIFIYFLQPQIGEKKFICQIIFHFQKFIILIYITLLVTIKTIYNYVFYLRVYIALCNNESHICFVVCLAFTIGHSKIYFVYQEN